MAKQTDVELAKERRDRERAQRNVLDEMLIKNARKSPEQIESATGIPARQALERLAEILHARDWMTERMEERLLLIEMGDLIDGVKRRLEHASEQYYADTANVALRGYEAISKRMDARRNITEDDMLQITRVQAEGYIEVLNEVSTEVGEYVAEVFPDLGVEVQDAVVAGFQRALPKAYEKVRSRIRG